MTTRLRKTQCDTCGYVARVTRSWLAVHPTQPCACGGHITPTDASDLAFCGLLEAGDISDREWTVVCRENGWEDQIVRHGKAAKDHLRRFEAEGGILGREKRGSNAQHCAFAGCGLWVKDGAEHCNAGHPQTESAAPVAPDSIPF